MFFGVSVFFVCFFVVFLNMAFRLVFVCLLCYFFGGCLGWLRFILSLVLPADLLCFVKVRSPHCQEAKCVGFQIL